MLVLKKYSNRKIYGDIDGRKGYLNISDVSDLVRQGKTVQVVKHNRGKPDHGQDVTLEVLKECLTRLVMSDTVILELIKRHQSEEA